MTTTATAERWTLRRIRQTSYATYGELLKPDGSRFCFTLERPFVDANHDGVTDRDVSCIPAGEFAVVRYASPKRGYDVFELQDVPERGAIEIHIGNLPTDCHGCILVGLEQGEASDLHGNNGFGIRKSKPAFDALMQHFAGVDRWHLAVVDVRTSAAA